jgi:hypothetical protein
VHENKRDSGSPEPLFSCPFSCPRPRRA